MAKRNGFRGNCEIRNLPELKAIFWYAFGLHFWSLSLNFCMFCVFMTFFLKKSIVSNHINIFSKIEYDSTTNLIIIILYAPYYIFFMYLFISFVLNQKYKRTENNRSFGQRRNNAIQQIKVEFQKNSIFSFEKLPTPFEFFE